MAVAVLAIAAIAWLAVGYRSTVLSDRAERLAQRPGQSPAQVREAEKAGHPS